MIMSFIILTAAISGCGNGGTQSLNNSQTAPQSGPTDVSEIALEEIQEITTTAKEVVAAESFAGGSGTEEDPYRIATKEQLRLLADKVNAKDEEYVKASYILDNDIEINPTESINDWKTTEPEFLWTVIGNGERFSAFEGHFDGKGNSISGLYYTGGGGITGDGRYAAGLFGRISEDAVIENVILKDSMIIAVASSECGIGGIVGETETLSNAVIKNCENRASIVVEGCIAGGVVGIANRGASVEKCRNSGHIVSTDGFGTIGGIVGRFSGYDLSDCNNEGEVSAKKANIGGVAGEIGVSAYMDFDFKAKKLDGSEIKVEQGDNIASNVCNVENLCNYGKVIRTEQISSAISACGGVIGDLANGSSELILSEIKNEGEVQGADKYLGGVIGYISILRWGDEDGITTIRKAENHVSLNSEKRFSDDNSIGGVIGYLVIEGGQELRLEDCINDADLTGNAGGIISTAVVYGGGTFAVTGCENHGEIKAESEGSLGGIINLLTCSKSDKDIPNIISIEKCKNLGNISGRSVADGGIIGMAELMNIEGAAFEVKECENHGEISFPYSEDNAQEGLPEFCGGIIGWLGTDEEGSYSIVDNRSLGDIVLVADDVDADKMSEEIKYFRFGGIVGLYSSNIELKDNEIFGKMKIKGIDFENSLPECGMEIDPTTIEQENKAEE